MNPPFDVTGMCIETDRLIMRPFTCDDLSDFNAYASVPGVGESAGWPHHKSIDDSRRVLEDFLRKKEVLALYHKQDARVIGSAALRSCWSSRNDKYSHLSAKELGYVISRTYWGMGIAAEAARALISYAFEVLSFDAIGAAHAPENTRSRRVLEKLGFTYIETGKFFSKQLGVEFDDMRYLLLREDARISSSEAIKPHLWHDNQAIVHVPSLRPVPSDFRFADLTPGGLFKH